VVYKGAQQLVWYLGGVLLVLIGGEGRASVPHIRVADFYLQTCGRRRSEYEGLRMRSSRIDD
jgi:hypothetical protein